MAAVEMTGLKELLKKKEKIEKDTPPLAEHSGNLELPVFKFIRTTTESEEVIQPPSYPGDEDQDSKTTKASPEKAKKRPHLGFRRSTNNASHSRDASVDSVASQANEKGEQQQQLPVRPKTERKLSERFHLHRDRPRSVSAESSTHLPDDLPEAPAAVPAPAREGARVAQEEKEIKEQREAQWEKRATILAQSNPLLLEEQQRQQTQQQQQQQQEKPRPPTPTLPDADQTHDENIQEAIRLHELGDLTPSTAMFGRLASPTGANNALAQVLYALALRHGWGIPLNPEKAIHYLSLAAANSASVEEQALAASGMTKVEPRRGSWRDPVAARQYYETAANLGDADAMEEAAWCLVEGFGGGKDKGVRKKAEVGGCMMRLAGGLGVNWVLGEVARRGVYLLKSAICRGGLGADYGDDDEYEHERPPANGPLPFVVAICSVFVRPEITG
ncbi:hypothetical protein B0A55_06319 [Friedmanniomyces simplex]|uniref:Protein DSF2 n=1 Tax=Friedmanniomyces simplex TaxID=329884 RepID=A0A4U0X927_9PEZI|nr:hypothetical protein B0A55_06319 [Friedmanniomyces simplex]